MSTCRFCKEDSGTLLKYEVRHYAHAKCLLDAKGAAAFDYFLPWQLENQWPYLPIVKAGLVKEFEARIAQASKRCSA
jgi:hypothetical protein